ncbi:hypothetical protein HUU42_14420, partial [bacterium]|nr:hypothetical protein [bacterium]
PIQLGSKASVVYEGWNEGGLMGYNYQRKWSVEQSRWIYPITQQKDFEESSKKLKLFQANTIVILTNAYSEKQMGDLFDALQYQNGIKTISDNSPLKLPVQTNDQYLDSINVQFNLENFLSLNGGMGFDPDTSLEIGDNVFQILDIIRKSTSYRNNKKRVFDGTTHFKNYQRSFKDSLTHEDKVYALIKLYTILKYFYPFFDEIMLDWDARFVEFIEQCPVSESLPQFYHYLCEFLQPLADSHVTLLFEKINSDYYTLPIKFDKIEGRTVVTEIKHKILPDSLKILKGTELIKINGFAIEDFEKMWLKRISFSTPAAGLRNVYSYHIPPSPINGPFGSEVELTILAPDSLSAKKIYFKRTVSPNEWRTDMVKRPSSYKIQNIGYIDISRIDSIGQYESTIKEMMDTKAIIIDLRKRPTIGSVNKIVSPFIKDTLNVGFEEIPLITSSRMSWIRNEFRFNGNSKIYYKKPLIILINENSQSGTETIASIFKAAKRAVFIGSQTAGTTGALSWIFLDNLGYATFTGCRIGNAEGNLLWQHGIIPDITVKPTLKGIREDKDEVLETAVSYINQNFE